MKNTGSSMAGSREAVTVVTAVRNGELFIVEAVQSTLALLAAMGSDRVVTLRNPGRGVSTARNFGASQADTKWLLFLDADDRLVDGGLAHLLNAADREPDAIVAYGDYERINHAGQRIGRRFLVRSRGKPSGDILAQIVRVNFII